MLRQSLAAAVALLTALGPLAASPAGAASLPVGPAAGDMDLSPFYRWDGPLPETPGAVLRREPMPAQPEMTAAGEALRILHTSTDARWNSGQVPVSGILYLPKGAVPNGGWPLLSWAHGTLGIADVCAPSWTGVRTRDAVYMNRWLAAGFAVVATDYQGLGGPGPHPYLNWEVEGRSVLDAARAAIAEGRGRVANRVMVAGQSQGSGAALGAAKLARTYAPDLKVMGAVATGLNATFPKGPVALPPRNSDNLFLALASGGLKDDGPRVEDIVTPKGLDLLTTARAGCTKQIGLKVRELKVGSLSDALTVSQEALGQMTLPLTDMDGGPLGVPVFIGTGLSDATLTPLRQYAAAKALCAAGDKVLWKTYPGLGHDGALHGSFDQSLAFARRTLKGAAMAPNCASIAPPGPPGALNPKAAFNDD